MRSDFSLKTLPGINYTLTVNSYFTKLRILFAALLTLRQYYTLAVSRSVGDGALCPTDDGPIVMQTGFAMLEVSRSSLPYRVATS